MKDGILGVYEYVYIERVCLPAPVWPSISVWLFIYVYNSALILVSVFILVWIYMSMSRLTCEYADIIAINDRHNQVLGVSEHVSLGVAILSAEHLVEVEGFLGVCLSAYTLDRH